MTVTTKSKSYATKAEAQKIADRLMKAEPNKTWDVIEENGKFHVQYVKPISEQDDDKPDLMVEPEFPTGSTGAIADQNGGLAIGMMSVQDFIEGKTPVHVSDLLKPAQPATPKLTKAPAKKPGGSKKATSHGDDEVVVLHVKHARLTEMYVITPAIGTSKNGPLERWIEKKQLQSYVEKDKGIEMIGRRSIFESRGIPPADLKPYNNEIAA